MPVLRGIQKGEVIRASYLNRITDEINTINGRIAPPHNDGNTPAPAPIEAGSQGEVWNETTRTVQTVRVYDPEDEAVYVDVEQTISISFETADGRMITMNLSP